MRLKKNDTVKIIAGKDKGKTGRIVKIDPVSERVVVQGANMVKKTMKKKIRGKGGINGNRGSDSCFQRCPRRQERRRPAESATRLTRTETKSVTLRKPGKCSNGKVRTKL
jgi:hypothetical protein